LASRKLIAHKISKVVIGTETLTDLDFVRSAVERFGNEKIVVSLDLKDGNVLSNSPEIQAATPLGLALKLQDMGISEMILLDLARVGSGKGVDVYLLEEMLSSLSVKILAGGGVRDVDELLALKDLSVHGVLMATSLHSGRVSVEALKRLNWIRDPTLF